MGYKDRARRQELTPIPDALGRQILEFLLRDAECGRQLVLRRLNLATLRASLQPWHALGDPLEANRA